MGAHLSLPAQHYSFENNPTVSCNIVPKRSTLAQVGEFVEEQ